MGQDNARPEHFRKVMRAVLPTPNERWDAFLKGERQAILYSVHKQDPHDVGVLMGSSTGFVADTLRKVATKSGPVRPQILSFIASVDLSEKDCLTLCSFTTSKLDTLKGLSADAAKIVECLASGFKPEETCEELEMTPKQYQSLVRSIVTHLDIPDESFIAPMAIVHHIRARRNRAEGATPVVAP